jgi:heme oxygenase
MLIQPSPNAVTRLRTETAELRRRVDHELDLYTSRTSWLDYRLYLFRMYGFHVPVERALAITPGLSTVIRDAALRNNKVALLSHDLVSLGVDRRDLAQLPRMPVPTLHALPAALGWMFVVESATLEAKALARHLSAQLPLEMESASAFLGCYGAEVATRWRELEDALDAFATSHDAADELVAAAQDCLGRLARWLRPSAVPARARMHA